MPKCRCEWCDSLRETSREWSKNDGYVEGGNGSEYGVVLMSLNTMGIWDNGPMGAWDALDLLTKTDNTQWQRVRVRVGFQFESDK